MKPDTLYGFFYCSCIYESADALQSLHRTKAGAWHALRAALFARAVQEREAALRFGRHLTVERWWKYERYTVHPIEVQE